MVLPATPAVSNMSVKQNAILTKDIKNKDLTKDNLDEAKQPVAKHLTQPDHTGNIDQLTCHILDFIKFPAHSDRAALERNEKERIWIARLETVRPHGLNTMEPKPFLRSVIFK